MAKLQLVKATTSQTVLIFIQDSSSTTGAGLTGLTSASSGLTAYYYREGAGTGATAISLAATGSLGTWETGGFFEVDSTNMPGWYELGLPDAVLATGVDFVGVQLKGATNMAPCNLEIQLTSTNVNDATKGGMTGLLSPTVAGRTLDVTATGAAGIDWGNVENPTTAVDLSGTDIQLCDTVTTNTDMRGTDNAATAASLATAQADLDTITGADGAIIASGAITNATLAGNMEIVFETDFATNYNATRNAWVTNAQDFVGTTGADPFSGTVVAASVTGNVGGSIGSLGATAKSDVNAEVVDALATDTYAEPAQGTPGATITLAAKIGFLYKAWRNKFTTTSSEYDLYNDDAATVDHKATLSDDGSVYTKGEVTSGP